MIKAAPHEKWSAFHPGVSGGSHVMLYLAAEGYQMLATQWKSSVGHINLDMKRVHLTAFIEANARDRLEVAAEVILPRTSSTGLSRQRTPPCSHPRHAG
jgi:Holliday junction resolvase-like predicted endonuclease